MPHAIHVRENGGPDVLRFEPHEPGAPGPGQARVRVAVSTNSGFGGINAAIVLQAG